MVGPKSNFNPNPKKAMNTTEPRTLTIKIPETLSLERETAVGRELETIVSAILVSLSVVDISPEFYQRRDALIADAKAVAQVQNTEDEGKANAAYKALNALKKEVEAQSTGFKTPLNAAKTRIIDIVDTGLEPLEKAMDRIKSMSDGYAAEKIAEQRRQEAERQAAIARAQAEQRAAEEAAAKLAREQESARLAAEKAQQDADEAARRAAEANSPEAKAAAAKAQQEAAEAQRKAKENEERLAQEAQDAADLAEAAAMLPTAPPVAEADARNARGQKARMMRSVEIIGGKDEFHLARNAERFAIFAIQNPEMNLIRFLKIGIKKSDLIEALKDDDFLKETPPGLRIWSHIAP